MSWLKKLRQVAREELGAFHPRLEAAGVVGRAMPPGVAVALRSSLLRQVGFSVGEEVEVVGQPRITGGPGLADRLKVGARVRLELDVTLDLEEVITLEDDVTVGHQAMVLTSSHQLGPASKRAGPVERAPVTIKKGAWLGPRCIILPGVTVGEGAIVNAGALVNKDVTPHTRVGGVPARQLAVLDGNP